MSWLSDHWTRAFDPLNFGGLDKTAKNDAYNEADGIAATAPRPADLTYSKIFDPNSQSLYPDAMKALAGINLDDAGIDQFKSEAMRRGPSDFAKRAGDEQDYLAMQAKDAGAKTVSGQGATARTALAARGGLSGGAAERVAMDGQDNYLNMTQGVNNELAKNKMQIGLNDEQNRISQLGSLPGMEAQKAGFDLSKEGMALGAKQADVSNAMQDAQGKNQFDSNMYNQKMGAYGAAQTASATLKSGKHKK